MKRFCVIFFLVFLLIDAYLLYYIFFLYPNMSGEMGFVGQIPFGRQYMDSIKQIYDPQKFRVYHLNDGDSVTSKILVFGDSFSHFKKYGYSQVIGETFDVDIQDISTTSSPEQSFIQYAKNGLIPRGTIVIIESVERNFVGRLKAIKLDENYIPKIRGEQVLMSDMEESPRVSLSSALNYIRRRLGIKQYVLSYSTTVDLFSHSSFHNKLFIFNSQNRWDYDGDLLFLDDENMDYSAIYENLYTLYSIAESHQIHLVYLVAADKYDVYEPFITSNHPTNPTLNDLPTESWIINTKPLLQEAAYNGIKDVYYINDTHWSPIGAKIVGEEVAKRIIDLYMN